MQVNRDATGSIRPRLNAPLPHPIVIVSIIRESHPAVRNWLDRLGPWILILSISGFLSCLLICLYALYSTNIPCELVHISSKELKDIIQTHWLSEEPFMSLDRSFLIRIAAHLEYDVDIDYIEEENNSKIGESNSIFSSFDSPTDCSPEHEGNPNNEDNICYKNSNSTTSKGSVPLQNNNEDLYRSNDARRFLILDFDQLTTAKLYNHRYKVKLNSNCSTLTMFINRGPRWIYIDQILVKLKRPNKQLRTCQAQLPKQGAFKIELINGLAHYYCDKPHLLQFKCYHYELINPSSNKTTTDEPIVETNFNLDHSDQNVESIKRKIHLANLHIHLLEYEIKNNTNELDGYELNFESTQSHCIG